MTPSSLAQSVKTPTFDRSEYAAGVMAWQAGQLTELDDHWCKSAGWLDACEYAVTGQMPDLLRYEMGASYVC